jgi:polar amino acid transport system substrate-binding protein
LDNVKRDGVSATYAKVKRQLDNYKELGYSSAGVVLESAVESIGVGDRVACAGTAHHAEIILVSKNLVARIPEGVEFSEASFTTLGAIALQGIRQAHVNVGESAAVIGLGLLGLLTVQILKASGCRVIGLDISKANFALAKELGCDECISSDRYAPSRIASFTRGYGTDAVLITASTNSNQPMELALQCARKRSSVVVVGAVGMNVPRSPFYEKELSITISCSYGPGRYDSEYELKGTDYPVGYVRWTENRNMEAVLDLLLQKKLLVGPLISHRFPVKEALKAYDIVTRKSKEKCVGILIEYPGSPVEGAGKRTTFSRVPARESTEASTIGFIGAGNFAQSYLLPYLKGAHVELKGVATARPVNAQSIARKFGFSFCATDPREILDDPSIASVFIATRHDSHAQYVVEAIKRKKNVFVEKPLAVNADELAKVRKAYAIEAANGAHVMVGFNRRFSKPFVDMYAFLGASRQPMMINYRVSAGTLPAGHWMHDPAQGGRIVGEACHFIDCMQFLTGARPIRVFAEAAPKAGSDSAENVSATIRFSDGSVGTLLYLADGDPSVGKEYCEVHRGDMTVIMNNFNEVICTRGGEKSRKKYDGSKGHEEEVRQAMEAFTGRGGELISFESLCDTTSVTFKILESLQRGRPINV